MRALTLACVLLSLTGLAFGSRNQDEASGLMQSAIENVDLRGADAKSFQLEVDFRAQLDVPMEGHLSLKWAGRDRWYELVRMSKFQEIRVRNDEGLWITRNLHFTPLRVSEVEDLLRVLTFNSYDGAKALKREQRDGVSSNCVEVRSASRFEKADKRRVCVDAATNDVITDEQRQGDDLRVKSFADYQPFGTHRYPKKFNLVVNGSPIVQATVTRLEESSFDERSFRQPSNSILRPQCEHITSPKTIKAPGLEFSGSAAGSAMGGTVIVALTVEPDNSADNIYVIESAGRERDAAVKEMLSHWSFQPATCGDRAVPYDAHVKVDFSPTSLTPVQGSTRQQVARVSFHD